MIGLHEHLEAALDLAVKVEYGTNTPIDDLTLQAHLRTALADVAFAEDSIESLDEDNLHDWERGDLIREVVNMRFHNHRLQYELGSALGQRDQFVRVVEAAKALIALGAGVSALDEMEEALEPFTAPAEPAPSETDNPVAGASLGCCQEGTE